MSSIQPATPLVLPRPVPTRAVRQPKKNIPQTLGERTRVLAGVRSFVSELNLVPPVPEDDLKGIADQLVERLGIDPIYRDYVGVLLNNELWREQLAAVPYERRLLLLPKCLRIESKCPAPFDEFGLLCKQCGLCSIQDLQNEAERLGYAVLVAEGSAIVMSLIQTGKIEAIVGVSCLSVLERAFPYMEAAAIPGVAIPLLQDDCIDTNVDMDWVWEYIHLTSDDKTRRMNLSALREEVDSWFSPENLREIMGDGEGESERIARDWLGRAGKRWRPFLSVAVFQALRENPEDDLPADIRKLAVAVECFHKASLVHDDIEDQDEARYGEKTLHEAHGIPVALNIGDLLIGEGYRLLSLCNVSAKTIVAMIRVASEGQRQLCRGQGAELVWSQNPSPLSSLEVLDIFRKKTAPAFEVALHLGALYSGRFDEVSEVLSQYSEALGIAYQIRDDLSDLGVDGETNDIAGFRPSLLLALAFEKAKGEQKDQLKTLWMRQTRDAPSALAVEALYRELQVDQKAELLLESYKEEAIRSLAHLNNANLKGLLRRVMGKIFNDTEIQGWCKEFETRNGVRPPVQEEPSEIKTVS